jgi:hypothetical protein
MARAFDDESKIAGVECGALSNYPIESSRQYQLRLLMTRHRSHDAPEIHFTVVEMNARTALLQIQSRDAEQRCFMELVRNGTTARRGLASRGKARGSQDPRRGVHEPLRSANRSTASFVR